MVRAIVFIGIFISLSQSLWAQPSSDTIVIKRTWLGTYYEYDGRNIGYHKIHKLLATEPDALKILRRAQTARYLGLSLYAVGFACVLSSDFSFHHPYENGLFIAGTGFVVASIPFTVSFTHQLRRAVRAYNGSVQGVGYMKPPMEVHLSFSGNAAGVVINF